MLVIELDFCGWDDDDTDADTATMVANWVAKFAPGCAGEVVSDPPNFFPLVRLSAPTMADLRVALRAYAGDDEDARALEPFVLEVSA